MILPRQFSRARSRTNEPPRISVIRVRSKNTNIFANLCVVNISEIEAHQAVRTEMIALIVFQLDSKCPRAIFFTRAKLKQLANYPV